MRHHIESLESRATLSSVTAIVYPTQTPSSTETASASIVATQLTATDFQYSITVKDTATGQATAANQIGTFWYAWVPGSDYLDIAPLTVSSPSGWSDRIIHGGPNDGYSVQWVASSNAIRAGNSLGGFVFDSSDSPAQVFGHSTFYPTVNVNTAFIYAGAPETDAGSNLTPAASVTPTPTPVTPAPTPTGPTPTPVSTTPTPVTPTPTPVTPTAKQTASARIVASQPSATAYQYSITQNPDCIRSRFHRRRRGFRHCNQRPARQCRAIRRGRRPHQLARYLDHRTEPLASTLILH